jgi:hypothetical protein
MGTDGYRRWGLLDMVAASGLHTMSRVARSPECSSCKTPLTTNALQSYSTRSPYVQPPSDNTSQSKYVLEHILRVYSRGDIPVGDYDPDRIANLGGGHASWDSGFGYTYFNAITGLESTDGGGNLTGGQCFC